MGRIDDDQLPTAAVGRQPLRPRQGADGVDLDLAGLGLLVGSDLDQIGMGASRQQETVRTLAAGKALGIRPRAEQRPAQGLHQEPLADPKGSGEQQGVGEVVSAARAQQGQPGCLEPGWQGR